MSHYPKTSPETLGTLDASLASSYRSPQYVGTPARCDYEVIDVWISRIFPPSADLSLDMCATTLTLPVLHAVREALTKKIESFDIIFDCRDDASLFSYLPEGSWTFTIEEDLFGCAELERAVSAAVSEQCSQFVAMVVPVFDFAYRAGELVGRSFIDSLFWLHVQLQSWIQQLRLVASLIARLFRSGKGTSTVSSVFVYQQSWYLQHSAHPPATAITAVEGRFAATLRRACFRPLFA
jgi:phytoene dehydrogenase-like protein